MKETLLKLLNAVLMSAAISAILAGVAYAANVNVLMTFAIAFVLQFIVSYLYGMYIDLKAAKIAKENQLKELEILTRVTFNVDCAACKKPNEVIINPNTDNGFTCTHCNAENSVYFTAEAALVTVPLNVN